MPRRPRQHQLETASRLAFEASLPPRWLFRGETPDYGIDGSVEVFDEDGQGLGLRFFVQLKASDAVLKRNPRVRIRRATADYYRSLDLPVLVVYYNAPSEQLFGRWFHEFDRYSEPEGTTWVTFQLPSSALLTTSKWEVLKSDLSTIRGLLTGQVGPPYRLSFSSSTDDIAGHSIARVMAAIREQARHMADLVELVDGDDAHGRIEFTPNALRVQLSTRYSGSLLFETSKEIQPRTLAKDAFLMLGSCLARARRLDHAATLVLEFVHGSSVAQVPDMAPELVRIVLSAGRVDSALSLVELLEQESGCPEHTTMLEGMALLQRSKMSPSEHQFVLGFYARRIVRATEEGDSVKLAVSHYNLGNLHSADADFRKAVRHYRLAAKWDPTYRKRDYYWREMGGSLFQAKRYMASVGAYQEAIRIRQVPEWYALLADGLFFAGALGEASEAISLYFEKSETHEDEFLLLSFSIHYVRSVSGVETQTRQTRAANSMVGDTSAHLYELSS